MFLFESIHDDLSILMRLFIIAVLAGFLGWERETAGKAAGFRTHMLVGIASVLFISIGDIFVNQYKELSTSMRFDPIRIIEAIVTGISFIGAGIIFVAQRKGVVKNLTTAASILTTSAIGMVVGLERYFLAVITTGLVFIILRILDQWEIKGKSEKQKT